MRNQPEGGPAGARALLATRDQSVTEAVLATALALGAEVEVVTETDELRRCWATASPRLVGVDMAERAELLERRDGTFVVGAGGAAGLLEASARLRAPALALPASSGELADVLTAEAHDDATGQLVLVVGASGGLGVSSLVVGLATRAAEAGVPSAAVELAECGGGLDLLFGAETREGLRWGDLAHAHGRLGDLGGHLVPASGVSVLPLGRRDGIHPDEAAVAAVLGSLVRSHETVFVDAGRGPVVGPGAVSALGSGPGARLQQVLVVGADVVSVAAARMLVERQELASARVVVRTGPGRSLPADAVSESLGMDLLGIVRHDRAVMYLAEAGGSVASSRARRFRADVRGVWEAMTR